MCIWVKEEISNGPGKENVVKFGVSPVSSKANNLVPSLLNATEPIESEKSCSLSKLAVVKSLGVLKLYLRS